MKFPEGTIIKKVGAASYRNAFALDTDGMFWMWGSKFAYDDYYDEGTVDDPDLIPGFKDSWTPVKVEWFERNGMRVVDFSPGQYYCVLKVADKQRALSLYGFIHPD